MENWKTNEFFHLNSGIQPNANKYKEALTSSMKRREASLSHRRRQDHTNEERKRPRGGGWIRLGGRANKSLSIPPSRRGCHVTSPFRVGASVLRFPPTAMSAPPLNRQKAPVSRAPDSSLVCSQLLCWLHRPVLMPTCFKHLSFGPTNRTKHCFCEI